MLMHLAYMKQLKIASADGDVVKKKKPPSFTIGGNVFGFSIYGKQYGDMSKK